MNKDAIRLCLFGYGFAIQYRKDDFTNKDGSLTKFMFRAQWNEFFNPYIAMSFFYNYSLIFRLLIGRE